MRKLVEMRTNFWPTLLINSNYGIRGRLHLVLPTSKQESTCNEHATPVELALSNVNNAEQIP